MRWIVGVVLLVVIAAAFRLPDLATRVMHTDEAVNAVIANDLHQRAKYRYDPVEHHGPTLPFLTLPVLAASEVHSFDEMTESQLRGVTALVGILLVLVLALARPLLGTGATLATMLWLAVSPAAVYYSRYYIHEIVLVAFTTLALLAYGRATLRPTAHTESPAPAWLGVVSPWWILTGVSLGAMHATKETFVIAVGAAGLATIATAWWERRASPLPPESRRRRWWAVVTALLAAVIVSYALFSF
ncbi:MAG: phospholipid carrier-dependent glycosyltransferase, partial [Planctomycetota bacterium]